MFRSVVTASKFAIIVGTLALPMVARAGDFTSSSAFSAATTGLTVENYGSYSAGDLIADGGTLGALSYSFDTGAGLGGVITNLYNSFTGNSLAAKQGAGPLAGTDFFYANEGFTVTLPFAVTALGIFSNTNLPVDMTLTTSGGDTFTYTLGAYDTSTFGFIGITSSTPFTSATFHSTTFNIPAIEYGAAIPSVPEPAAWAIMLVGFAGIGGSLRRARAFRSVPKPA